MRRLIAAAAVAAFMAAAGSAAPRQRPHEAWEDMCPAQLTWVAEGLSERISELQDDLAYVWQLQAEKMAEAKR